MDNLRMDITVKGLTPLQVQELADFVESVINQGRRPVYGAPDADMRSATYARENAPAGLVDTSKTHTAQVSQHIAPPPPPVGNIPPPPPPPVPAPAAAPSAQAPAATASTAPRDSRGVPFDERYHSGTAAEPGVNDKGAWKKRRNHNPAELAAYEAQFLGKSAGGANAPAATGDAGNAAHAHQAAPPPPMNGTGQPMTGASGGAHLPPPPPPGTPGLQDFHTLWLTLVNQNLASPALENYMIATYGGHPVHSDAYSHDPAKRLEAYQFLKRYLPAA